MVHNSKWQTPVFRAVWHHLNTCKGYYTLEKSWLMKMIQEPFIALRKAVLCLLGVSPMKKLWPSDGSKGCSISHCLSFHTPSDLVLQWERTQPVPVPATAMTKWQVTVTTSGANGSCYVWAVVLWGRRDNWQAEHRATLIWSFLENRLMSFFQNQSLKQTNKKSPEQNKPTKNPLKHQSLT